MTLAFRPRLWLGALCAAAVMTVSASAQTSPAQKEEFEKIIREYLLKNPEVIQEAIVELRKRQEQAEIKARSEALKTQRETLFNSPRGIVIGNPKGNVTLVEFFDYNCGYCKRAMEDVTALSKANPKLRVVLKDFPILGPDSVEASRVAVAAKNQLQGAKYFEFHNKLMAVKGKVNAAKALDVAKEAGADVAQLKKDIEAPATKAAIADTVALGDRLGLTGTPAFIIGDEIVFGAVGQAALKAKIDSVRRCGKTDCAG